MITLEHVSKTYAAGVPALNDVSLEIEDGEFVFVVGDSGSGKSTLIKLLLKELEPTEGSITIAGKKLGKIRRKQIPKFRRNIGVVFQDFRLLKDRNVYDNVAFAQKVVGEPNSHIKKKVPLMLSMVGLAGTRRRGVDAEEDALLRDELLRDEKERAEHVMLVDLARNDMGRISEFGTVKVTQFMEVQNYSHVMHIVSMVEGKKKGEFHPLDLVSSFLPAGTLSGAPKIRAMEIIDELESVRRGLYGGATGYIDFSGDMDFCITIRTMIKKGNRVYLQAGAGIVADSVPENEYQECCNKVMALAKTLIEEENL